MGGGEGGDGRGGGGGGGGGGELFYLPKLCRLRTAKMLQGKQPLRYLLPLQLLHLAPVVLLRG